MDRLSENSTRSRVDQLMVRMIAEVAQAAGLQTVAEYVESAAALKLLLGNTESIMPGLLCRARRDDTTGDAFCRPQQRSGGR
jgi:EAL domain-containing protein (putative c-di-GMP-specific phosphodiesterase class I)